MAVSALFGVVGLVLGWREKKQIRVEKAQAQRVSLRRPEPLQV